jgi:hypothetical protein
MGSYEPPLTRAGSTLIPGQEGTLAPGVRGYAILSNGLIYIPLIIAEKEGSGDVGRFLDSLSPRCVIPNVISSPLSGMLRRRGWRPYFDGEAYVWERL